MTKREQEIIAAAAEIFKEKGYQAATTRDIAAAVGIQQATLYYYVSSKEELLYLVVCEPMMRLYAQMEEIVTSLISTLLALHILDLRSEAEPQRALHHAREAG